MIYDGFTLAAVIAELRQRLNGGRVQKIRQHDSTDITLEIRGPGHTYQIFFSIDARFSRVYLTSSAAPVPQEPPNFCMLLRKHVQGGYLTAIDQVGMDRVARFTFEYPDHTKLTLIFELMGKHSNLILVNSEEKILGAMKHVGSSISRIRQILPGRDYLPPPGEAKVEPMAIDDERFGKIWPGGFGHAPEINDVRNWLMSVVSGVGPFLADEIVLRSETDSHVSRETVKNELIDIGEMARTGRYMPVFITDERGRALMVYPMPSIQFPPDRQHTRTSINEALDALFRSVVSRSLLDNERTQTTTAIRRALATRRQTLKSIERTIAEFKNAETHRQTGELLLANLTAFETGVKSVSLTNYFDPELGETVIELDEKLTPQQNAERYFKRYQKARDSVSTAQQRRDNILREIDLLEAEMQNAESASSVDLLKNIRKSLTERDLLRQEVILEKQESEFGGERIRRYTTPDGWEILYGENSKANDYLTQRVARPNDVWMHARQITGAHVVIRTAGHSAGVPRPVLIQAARIAAQNSDAKHSSLVPIDYTFRKYVRKPKGSAPGFVTYRNEKTTDINPKE